MIEFNNEHAAGEGWVISDCEGSDNGPWQLQKLDESDVFQTDQQAWRFVVGKANDGSAYHQSALVFLMEHNLHEFDYIRRNALR